MAEAEAHANPGAPITTGPGRLWRLMLYMLLTLEAGYLCAELAFNGALLNVASGTVGSLDDIEHLEHTGRLLSGFGLGLLLYGFLVIRKRPLRITRALGFLAIFPPAIAGMYFAQSLLVDKAIVEPATDEDRFAAIYMAHLRPALRDGTVTIEDIPLSPTTMDRPESKAFLTLVTPILLHNDALVEKFVEAAPELIKYQVYSQAMENLEESYDQYLNASSGLRQLWYQYASSTNTMEKQLSDAKNGFSQRAEITMLSKKFQMALDDYRESPRRHWMPPPGLSSRQFLTHPKTLSHLGIEEQHHGVVQPGMFNLSPKRFQHQPDILVDAKPAIYAVIDHRIHGGFQDQWNSVLLQSGLVPEMDPEELPEIPLGLDDQQAFASSDWAQAVFQKAAGADNKLDTRLMTGWDRPTFFEEVLLPQSWDIARGYIDGLPANLNDLKNSDIRKRADESIRMAYVPTIALAISLLFSFLTAGKIASRVWMIMAGKRESNGIVYHGVRWLIPVAVLAGVLAAPFWTRNNSLAQAGVIEAAARESIPVPTTAMLKWTLSMEPLLYPAGNALLMLTGFVAQPELTRYAQYHDPGSGNSDYRAASVVDDLQFSLPLPVRQLQRTLQSRGYQPGPADGVIGESTIGALKAFQADQDLPQTGRQDPETINVLRQAANED